MKYRATVLDDAGRGPDASVPEYALDAEETATGLFELRFDGRAFRVDARRVSRNALSILMLDTGESFDVDLAEDGEVVNVLLHGEEFAVQVLDERRARLRATVAPTVHTGPHEVRAPMPGKVVRVLVAEGEAVAAGAGLVVVEAMKMENELKAAGPGRVARVLAREGVAVEAGAVLVVIE